MQPTGHPTAPTAQPDCIDHTNPDGSVWSDSYGTQYTCAWYALEDNCEEWGHTSMKNGLNANMACCVCGGGDDGSTTTTPTVKPTPFPTPEPTTAQPTPFPTPVTGFNFGSGCRDGDGSFTRDLPERYQMEELGIIPAGKFDVKIQLEADGDLDITLFDVGDTSKFPEGKAIVAWCSAEQVEAGFNCGLLQQAWKEKAKYKDMKITYSGFHGDGLNLGNEYIRIKGETSTDLMMKVFAYEVGEAKVTYSWAHSRTDCCRGVPDACGGTFTATLDEDQILRIGEIPVGKGDLRVSLDSDVDIDIQLYDMDDTSTWAEGQAIAGYCQGEPCNYGPLTTSGYNVIDYHDRTYVYSGYDGVDGQQGNEFIEIEGITNRNLMMTFYGYKAGTATVTYSYTEPSGDSAAVKSALG